LLSSKNSIMLIPLLGLMLLFGVVVVYLLVAVKSPDKGQAPQWYDRGGQHHEGHHDTTNKPLKGFISDRKRS
jgi:hypothetical protein